MEGKERRRRQRGDLEEVGGGGRLVLGNVARPAVNGML